jgi:hypothetical protein
LGLTDDAQRALGASLREMTLSERVAADYRELGLSPTAHAVELFRERLAVVAAILLLAMPGAAPVAAEPLGEVRATLTLGGDVPAGEIHQLYFDTGNAGQTLFGFCGQMLGPCTANTYEIRIAGLDPRATFSYRFERVTSDGVVTSYFEGEGAVGEVTEILAEFRYGVIPDTAVNPPASSGPLWLFIVGLTVGVTVLGMTAKKRMLR